MKTDPAELYVTSQFYADSTTNCSYPYGKALLNLLQIHHNDIYKIILFTSIKCKFYYKMQCLRQKVNDKGAI